MQDIGNDPTPAIFGPWRQTIIQPNSNKLFGCSKELCNIKSRHWDLYAKPDASIGFNKKPKNVVFSII